MFVVIALKTIFLFFHSESAVHFKMLSKRAFYSPFL